MGPLNAQAQNSSLPHTAESGERPLNVGKTTLWLPVETRINRHFR